LEITEKNIEFNSPKNTAKQVIKPLKHKLLKCLLLNLIMLTPEKRVNVSKKSN
jgi:hypothetical protein